MDISRTLPSYKDKEVPTFNSELDKFNKNSIREYVSILSMVKNLKGKLITNGWILNKRDSFTKEAKTKIYELFEYLTTEPRRSDELVEGANELMNLLLPIFQGKSKMHEIISDETFLILKLCSITKLTSR